MSLVISSLLSLVIPLGQVADKSVSGVQWVFYLVPLSNAACSWIYVLCIWQLLGSAWIEGRQRRKGGGTWEGKESFRCTAHSGAVEAFSSRSTLYERVGDTRVDL